MYPAVISRSVFYRSRMDLSWSKKALTHTSTLSVPKYLSFFNIRMN
jgi:hypothetical protein